MRLPNSRKLEYPFINYVLYPIVDQQHKQKKNMMMTKIGVSPNSETEGNFTTMKFENESQNSGFHKF